MSERLWRHFQNICPWSRLGGLNFHQNPAFLEEEEKEEEEEEEEEEQEQEQTGEEGIVEEEGKEQEQEQEEFTNNFYGDAEVQIGRGSGRSSRR